MSQFGRYSRFPPHLSRLNIVFIPTKFTQYISDSLTLADIVSSIAVGLNKSDSVTLVDSIAKAIGLLRSDSITEADNLLNEIGLTRSDFISLTDSNVKTVVGYLSDIISLIDNINASIGNNFVLSLSDSISLSDVISFQIVTQVGGGGGSRHLQGGKRLEDALYEMNYEKRKRDDELLLQIIQTYINETV